MIIYDPKITGSFDVNGTSISSLDQIDVTSGSVSSLNDATSSYALIAEISGSTTSLSSSLEGRVSDNETSVSSLNSASSSYALETLISGSFTSVSSSLASELLKNTTDTLTGDLTVTGTLTAQDLHVQEVTSSIVFSSGSNKFGSLSSDTQKITGSLQVSGSTNYFLGDVGIGTTSPSARGLQINKANADSGLVITRTGTGAAQFQQFIDGEGNIRFNNYSSTDSVFYTSDTERMRIDSNGNVGIGTNSVFSGNKLDVRGGNIMVGGFGGGTDYGLILTPDDGSGYWNITNITGGALTFNNSATIGSSEKMRINGDGSIGIGTTSPNDPFHLHMTNGAIRMDAETDRNHILSRDSNDSTWRDLAISAISGQKQLVLTTGGSVGIGTTTISKTLTVNGEIFQKSRLNLQRATSGATTLIQFLNEVGSDRAHIDFGGTNEELSFFAGDGTTSHMHIKADGNVGVGTSSPEDKLHVYGQLKADQIKTRSFSSLSGSPSSGDWFPIGTISDTNPSIVTYYIKTYAHSSIAFTVSEGYSADNRGHVQIIDHTYSANGGYANVSGVRIRQNGVVEIKLQWSSGPSVNIKITAVGVQAPEISTSLAATTETSTVVDTIDVSGNYGMMRAAGNILAQGNIGVGTTDPSDARVTITGTGNPVGIGDEYGHTGIKFYGAQTGQLEIFNTRGNTSYGNIIFKAGSSESMRIQHGGNVGIGTSSPDALLQLYTANQKVFELVSTDADGPYAAYKNTSTTLGFIGNAQGITNAGTSNFGIRANSSLVFSSGGANERMRIDSSGRVSVNDTVSGNFLTNYDTKLLVGGEIIARSLTANESMVSIGGNSNGAFIKSGKQDGSLTDRPLNLITGEDIRISIASSGDVGIGTTSPGDKLDVNGRIRARSNDGNTTAYIARTFEFGHPGNTGNFTRTFNVEDDLGYNRRGGAVTIIAHTWTNEHQFGIISWNNAGGGDNLTTVAYNSISSAGDFSISVSVNSANDNTIDVTFSNAHSNSHGWHAYLQGMF